MNPFRLSEIQLRLVAPPVLALWGLGMLVAAAVVDPILRQIPHATDQDIFRPGALMLIETIRLHRKALLHSAGQGVVLFLVAQLLLLGVRSRLYGAVAESTLGTPPPHRGLTRLPHFIGLSLVQLLSYGLLTLATGQAIMKLPGLEGTLAPDRVLPLVTVAGVGVVSLLASSCLFDLLKLSLYHARHERTLVSAWRALKAGALVLMPLRAARSVATAAVGVLVVHIAARPLLPGPTGSALTFLLGQSLVLFTLGLEAWWLHVADQSLVSEREPTG